MKKPSFDNGNDCTCVDQKMYHTRTPAEKPFETKPKKRKSKYAAPENGNRTDSPARQKHTRKSRNSSPNPNPLVLYQPIPAYFAQRKYDEPKHDCVQSSGSSSGQNATTTMSCNTQSNKNYTNHIPVQYTSSSTDDQNLYSLRQKGILNGQYPCPCMHIPIPEGMPFPKQADFGTHTDRFYENSKPSPGRRAWCYIKKGLKNIGSNKRKKRKKCCTCKSKSRRNNNSNENNFQLPYMYSYPVPYQVMYGDPNRATSRKKIAFADGQRQGLAPEEYNVSTQESATDSTPVILPSKQQKHRFDEDNECCCICDPEICSCECCGGDLVTDVQVIHTQTSSHHLSERCTQTDFPKQCCRCCRCCNKNKRCAKCKSIPRKQGSVNIQSTNCLPQDCSMSTNYAKNKISFENSLPKCESNQEKLITPRSRRTDDEHCTRTQIVRTSACQCGPSSQNKATSCICDEKFSPSRMNHFYQSLYGQNYDTHPLVAQPYFNKSPKTGNKFQFISDLNPITRASLMYSSLNSNGMTNTLPGRKQNFQFNHTREMPNVTDTQLPKLLDPTNLPSLRFVPYCTDVEHGNLVTAICEAVLSKDEEKDTQKEHELVSIGHSELLFRNNLCSDQNLPCDCGFDFMARTQNNAITSKNFMKDLREIPRTEQLQEKFPQMDQIDTLEIPGGKNQNNKELTITQPLFAEKQTKDELQQMSFLDAGIHLERVLASRKYTEDLLNRLHDLREKTQLLDTTVNKKKAVTEQNMTSEKSNKSNELHNNSVVNSVNSNLSQILEEEDQCNQNSCLYKRKPTSSSKSTGNISTDIDQLKNLDFSSIRSMKNDDRAEQSVFEYLRGFYLNEKNFILNNLPSYSSTISNAYDIRMLLDGDKKIVPKAVEIPNVPLMQSTNLKFDVLDSSNKVHPESTKSKQKLPLISHGQSTVPNVDDFLELYISKQTNPERKIRPRKLYFEDFPMTRGDS